MASLNDLVSDCCGAAVRVTPGVTEFFVCVRCGKPCDARCGVCEPPRAG